MYREIVHIDIINRVLLLTCGGNTFSGFTIHNNAKTKRFIITARHCFEDNNEGDKITIGVRRIDGIVNVKCVFHPFHILDKDICVLSCIDPPRVTSAGPVLLGTDGVIFGQQVSFLGFPFGWFQKCNIELNDMRPLPFVKTATVSSLNLGDESVLVLDGINNIGFSGGPVCFKKPEERYSRICGVISGYYPSGNPLCVKTIDQNGSEGIEELSECFVQENSGLILASPIDGIEDQVDSL